MNGIFKGMDNAAEQIDDNFKNGSIVESGSNNNGSYIKFGDGTMVSWGTISPDSNIGFDYSGISRSDTVRHEFPIAFIETPQVMANVSNIGIGWWANIGINVEAFSGNAMSTATRDWEKAMIMWMAIGKWK